VSEVVGAVGWNESFAIDRQIVLHQLEAHNFGEAPHALAGERVLLPWLGQEKLDREVARKLEERGFLEKGHSLREDFSTALELITHPDHELTAWIDDRSSQLSSVSAFTKGRLALVLVRHGEYVKFTSSTPDIVVSQWFEQLPRCSAAQGNTITIPESQLTLKPKPHEPERNPELHRFKAVMNLARISSGQIHSARRDLSGRLIRHNQLLRYIDTINGRWLISFDGAEAGERWITAAPATAFVFSRKIEELLTR